MRLTVITHINSLRIVYNSKEVATRSILNVVHKKAETPVIQLMTY